MGKVSKRTGKVEWNDAVLYGSILNLVGPRREAWTERVVAATKGKANGGGVRCTRTDRSLSAMDPLYNTPRSNSFPVYAASRPLYCVRVAHLFLFFFFPSITARYLYISYKYISISFQLQYKNIYN